MHAFASQQNGKSTSKVDLLFSHLQSLKSFLLLPPFPIPAGQVIVGHRSGPGGTTGSMKEGRSKYQMIALKRAGTEDKRPINNMILVVQLLLLLLIITDKINKTFPIFKRGTVRWRFLSNIVI